MKPFFLQFQSDRLDIAGWFLQAPRLFLKIPLRLCDAQTLYFLEKNCDGIVPHRDDDEPSLIICDKNNSGNSVFQKTTIHLWYKKGQIHRDNDLPAEEEYYGSSLLMQRWYLRNELHRIGQPAIRYHASYHANNAEFYYRGIKHNVHGPAIVAKHGEEYWLCGRQLSQSTWEKYVQYEEADMMALLYSESLHNPAISRDYIARVLTGMAATNEKLARLNASINASNILAR